MRNLILGAGFSGMAAGIRTGATIYEATDKAGGICNSYTKEGFQFFNGGPHLLFGKGVGLEYIKSLVPVNEYEKIAGVYYNTMLPYPFQTMANKEFEGVGEKNKSLRSWLGQKFGREQCNLFFFPFNEKYTAGLYDQVIQDEDYKTPPSGSTGWVSTFCDPVNGLDDLVEKMANQCDIKYNRRAVKILSDSKMVEFSDGVLESYERLISTIPLGQLLSLCGKTDIQLPYTSVLVLNIGAEPGINLPREHWVYVPFCNTGFHRISFYSNIDKSKAPQGKVNLSVEIAFCGYEYEDLDIDYIIYHVIQELQSWNFIGKTIVVDPSWVRTAYTWLYRKEDRDNAFDWLKERDILSIGRYGKWKFQGVTQSIEDGLSV